MTTQPLLNLKRHLLVSKFAFKSNQYRYVAADYDNVNVSTKSASAAAFHLMAVCCAATLLTVART